MRSIHFVALLMASVLLCFGCSHVDQSAPRSTETTKNTATSAAPVSKRRPGEVKKGAMNSPSEMSGKHLKAFLAAYRIARYAKLLTLDLEKYIVTITQDNR
jgi:hypothetical protein